MNLPRQDGDKVSRTCAVDVVARRSQEEAETHHAVLEVSTYARAHPFNGKTGLQRERLTVALGPTADRRHKHVTC
jgi:hypothetical protein